MKFYKVLIPLTALALSIGSVAVGFASDKGENQGLKDYKKMQLSKKISQQDKEKISGLELSGFSIPQYYIKSAQEIVDYQGQDIIGLLNTSNEKLWFMMNGDEAEGIVVANESEPILMGANKKGKDLYKLHNSLKKEISKNAEVYYFEFQGGGIFLTVDDKGETVYLSQRAAVVLELNAHKKYKPDTILAELKKHAEKPVNLLTGHK